MLIVKWGIVNMWSIKRLLKDRKGFTLMELLCGLCIGSIVVGISLSILSVSQKSNSLADRTDDLLYNGNFAMEYIKYEIQNADKIISSDKIQDLSKLYPDNIGFVIMQIQGNEFNYMTFIIKENKLIRIARTFDHEVVLLAEALSGYNEICEYVKSFGDTSIDWDNKILYLDLDIGEKRFIDNFKATISLTSELDY